MYMYDSKQMFFYHDAEKPTTSEIDLSCTRMHSTVWCTWYTN